MPRPNAHPRVVDEPDVDEKLDAAIRIGLCRCFPKDEEVFGRTRGWHNTMPHWSVILEDGETVIGHVAVANRDILVGGETVHVAGVHNVFVLPAYRGQGLLTLLFDAVSSEGNRRAIDFGMLFCVPQWRAVYERVAYKVLEDRDIIRVDSDGEEKPIPEYNISMICPMARDIFPEGDIHLQGNDW